MVLFREAQATRYKLLQRILGWVQPCQTQALDQLSHPDKWSWEAEAVHEAWDRWEVPFQTGKAIVNELETGDPRCRIDGNAV